MKITSMHLYPRRWNVAAQVAEELKMVTYATPLMEERRKKKKCCVCCCLSLSLLLLLCLMSVAAAMRVQSSFMGKTHIDHDAIVSYLIVHVVFVVVCFVFAVVFFSGCHECPVLFSQARPSLTTMPLSVTSLFCCCVCCRVYPCWL